jgi:ABC-type transporter Mla subunit MlaD
MLHLMLNNVGVVLGVLGILFTVLFAIRYARRKDPRMYALTEQKVAISPDDPADIEIRYGGVNVDRISSTLLWFWNAGKEPIRGTDIPPAQPLVSRN